MTNESGTGTEFAAPPDEYAGPATITAASTSIEVQVALQSHFEPIDGQVHWVGRISPDDELADRCAAGQTVTITVGPRTAEGRLSDIDPWGRFRISGTGLPPIPD